MKNIPLDNKDYYASIYAKAIKGYYGKYLKDLLLSDNGLVLDITDTPYICPKCEYSTERNCLDVYRGNINNILHGPTDKTKLVFEYKHYCKRCGTKMIYDESVIY